MIYAAVAEPCLYEASVSIYIFPESIASYLPRISICTTYVHLLPFHPSPTVVAACYVHAFPYNWDLVVPQYAPYDSGTQAQTPPPSPSGIEQYHLPPKLAPITPYNLKTNLPPSSNACSIISPFPLPPAKYAIALCTAARTSSGSAENPRPARLIRQYAL